VTIKAADYAQGDHYARLSNAPFFVTHNTRETRFWRVRKDRMPGHIEEIETSAASWRG
jgi:type I restriction enzyme M protein